MDRAIATATAADAGAAVAAVAAIEERRAAPRVASSALASTIACRITPGRHVRIVNLSAAGMLVESSAPLFPGRTATLVFTRGERRVVLSSTVARSYLSAIDCDRATYEAGIAFDRRFDAARELEIGAG